MFKPHRKCTNRTESFHFELYDSNIHSFILEYLFRINLD